MSLFVDVALRAASTSILKSHDVENHDFDLVHVDLDVDFVHVDLVGLCFRVLVVNSMLTVLDSISKFKV